MSLLKILLGKLVAPSPRLRRRSHRNLPSNLQALESRLLLDAVGFQFADPHPEVGNKFGSSITPLSNGDIVVTSPNDDAGGGSVAAGTGAGAVYLFDGQSGALIGTLSGSHAKDQIGSAGVTALASGNFVVDSPNWNGGLGAVTFGDGNASDATFGMLGTVSSLNSLVGISTSDQVGAQGITALANGNYVVSSTSFKNGTVLNAGAVTWGSGTSGVLGTVTALNSLVGGVSNDNLGSGGVTELTNGNFVIASPSVSTTSIVNVGGVTWVNGGTGVHGLINAGNSLIGSTANDQVGSGGVTPLVNGNYVIDSNLWNSGSNTTAGAVTWGNGNTGIKGTITVANSLIGSTAADQVGSGGVIALNTGNYVVDSPAWHNAAVANAGAVTWGDGTVGLIGTISVANSLVGTTANDQVGGGVSLTAFGVTALTNGNYVVASPNWTNGAATSAGAATWGSGAHGISGIINATNSLVGDLTNDHVGFNGVTALMNGNYVVDSAQWNSGAITSAGAVTWGSGLAGIHGIVSSSNSLVGTVASDNVGDGGIAALTNGYYVVSSVSWHNGSIVGAGAATFGNGATGVKGTISSTNSLVGTSTNDQVGSGGIAALPNGNYVVDSYQWNNNVGAVTWGSGTAGVSGTISLTNSLVGSLGGDQIGGNGVTPLNNGNYVVDSDAWNQGMGAVTFVSGPGLAGTVGSANSLVGSLVTDHVGDGGVTPLGNGNFVVTSLSWGAGLGAITSGGNPNLTFVGAVNASTSITNIFTTSTPGNSISIVPDDLNNAVYAVVFPKDGVQLNAVGGGSSATGLVPLQDSSGFGVLQVSSYNGNQQTIPLDNASVGASLIETITVTNIGNGPLTVQPAFMVPFGDPQANLLQVQLIFLTNFNVDQVIAPGASASIMISPDTSNAVFTGGDVDIPNDYNTDALIHAGGQVTSPLIILTQGTSFISSGGNVNIGSTVVGTPLTTTITVKNSGDAPLRLTGITLPAGFSVVGGINFTIGLTLPTGASANFILQLNATVVGAQSGQVSIQSNEASRNGYFLVTGSVTAPKLQVKQGLTLLTNAVGTVNLGNTTLNAPLTTVITLTNAGSAPLLLQFVTVPAGFSLVGNSTQNQPVPVGASLNFTLKLNATATGNPMGVVTIATSDTTAQTFKFNVTGFVRPTAQAPLLVVQHGSTPMANAVGQLIFNSTSPGTAVSQVITVFNLGTVPLIVQPITAPTGFSMLTNFTMNQSIPAGMNKTITIQLNANATGTPNGIITLRTNDSTATSFVINVVANHRPTAITINPNVAAAQLANTVTVGSLSTTDPDISIVPQTFAYSIVSPTFMSGTTAVPVFTVDSRGSLSLALGAPVGVYANLSVTSTDQGGTQITQNQTLYITGTTTVGVAASTTVVDNTPSGYTIATLPAKVITVHGANGQQNNHASHQALGTNSLNPTTHTVNLLSFKLGGASIDDKYFTIDATGHLRTAIALNAAHQSDYHLDIISTNSLTGEITRYPYEVSIASLLKQTIVVNPATFRVVEGSINGTTVGRVSSSGAGGQAVSYAITGGNSGGAFTIDHATGQISVANSSALSITSNPTFSLTVQTSSNNTFGLATVNIGVARVTLSNTSIAANATIGTVIGQLNTSQFGSSGPFQYFLPAGSSNNSAFTVDSSGRLKLNATLNPAVQNSYAIAVNSIDSNGQSIASTFTITVVGASTVALSNNSIVKNASLGTVVGQLSATNNAAGNPFTMTLPAGVLNNSSFAMNANGQLTLNTALNPTVKSSYSIQVTGKDQFGLALTGTFTVIVLGPSDITLSNTTVAKNAPVGTVIGNFATVAATVTGSVNSFTYSLPPATNDNAQFSVDSIGRLLLNANLSSSTKASYTISVTTKDQRGLTLSKIFTIGVLSSGGLSH